MEGGQVRAGVPDQQQPPAKVMERLNSAVQQQLNLDSVKTRAISLFKAITRILEDFESFARTNADPRWQYTLGQFSMVNLELFSIVEDIKNVSKAFVVHPKNVNAENATVLPVMLSSKLLPEMESDDNTKREQLLQSMRGLPVAAQIDKLKTRIDMIGASCESAEKIIADARKAYFGTRQGPTVLPTIDKVQAAKIQEQENLLRSAVNHGEGLRILGDQRQVTSSLPMHLVDILSANDGTQSFADSSGMYQKNTPPLLSTTNNNNQGSLFQATGPQLIGRAAASPSGAAGTATFDNTSASPLQYANSPRSGANIMNTPSPQQQSQQQQLQQQHQQRQKIMQLPPHQQQLLAQQQLRQSSMTGLGQMHGQHHVQFSQPLAAQQLQGRQLTSSAMHMGQNQLNQGSHLNRQLNQFSSPSNSALFNAAQTTPTSQMGLMGPRWKGKAAEATALADPMSKIVSRLQSSLIESNSHGILSGCSVLLAAHLEQTEILNQACFGRPIITVQRDEQWFQLSLEEAFYLCYVVKCIKIIGENNCPINDTELWQYMTSKKDCFTILFKAYSHLRMKNWVVRAGSQYGVDFVVYRHHPALVHSEYAVLVLSKEDDDANGRLRVWSDFNCTLRLCGSVAKTLLVLFISKNGSNGDVSPSCLENDNVEERIITRWIPEQSRENQGMEHKKSFKSQT